MAFAGVNFIDVYFREGVYPSSPPFVPGLEGSGVVETAGPGAEAWVGKRVAFVHKGAGSHAEYAVVPASRLVLLPPQVALEDAASMMLQGMTAQYLVEDAARVRPNGTVLIHAAAGGTGRLIVQVAKMHGLRVIGTVSNEEKAEVAVATGADHVIVGNYSKFASRVLELTNNMGVDAVFDGVGSATLREGFRSLGKRCSMVLFGASSGAPQTVEISLLAAGSKSITRPSLFDFIAEDRTAAACDNFDGMGSG